MSDAIIINLETQDRVHVVYFENIVLGMFLEVCKQEWMNPIEFTTPQGYTVPEGRVLRSFDATKVRIKTYKFGMNIATEGQSFEDLSQLVRFSDIVRFRGERTQ